MDQKQIKTNATGELFIQESGGKLSRIYRFREALSQARISASTYYLWVKKGLVRDARMRDSGRWRLFTESELTELIELARQHSAPSGKTAGGPASGTQRVS
jgi:hypothetical protein